MVVCFVAGIDRKILHAALGISKQEEQTSLRSSGNHRFNQFPGLCESWLNKATSRLSLSSAWVKARPRTGSTPSVSNRLAVASAPVTRAGSSEPEISYCSFLKEPTDANQSFCWVKTRYSGGLNGKSRSLDCENFSCSATSRSGSRYGSSRRAHRSPR
jgi:hypothetical protein